MKRKPINQLNNTFTYARSFSINRFPGFSSLCVRWFFIDNGGHLSLEINKTTCNFPNDDIVQEIGQANFVLIVPLHLQLGEKLVSHLYFFHSVHDIFLVEAKSRFRNGIAVGVPLIQEGFI